MGPSQHEDGPKLVFLPSWWEVVLQDGSVVELRADAVQEGAEFLRFLVLVDGEPDTELELVRIPRAAVAGWQGGWGQPRSGSDRPPA